MKKYDSFRQVATVISLTLCISYSLAYANSITKKSSLKINAQC
jgi:hypothetical protein